MATVEALKDKKDIELLKTVLKQQSIRHYLLFGVCVVMEQHYYLYSCLLSAVIPDCESGIS